MSWRHALHNFFSSGTVISMAGGVLVTGSYIAYKDLTRYPRMMSTYATGNLLPPMKDSEFETVYFPRPELETVIRRTLSPTFRNEYFLINGDIGTGKTRTIVEVIRDMISKSGSKRLGAPVYVVSNQGKSFPDTLANAVNYYFDEHIGFKFFVDFLMRIHSIPQRNDYQKLVRVLDAIEKSSFAYLQKTGRPAVLVIDGITALRSNMPGALERLQEKAKIWADSNTVKLVFVNNDEETEALLHVQVSCWSRQAPPIIVEDLSRDDAIAFLISPNFMEHSPPLDHPMSAMEAERIVDLVGGRIHYLLTFKRNWTRGIPFEYSAEELKERERDKLYRVMQTESQWKVIGLLRDSKGQRMPLAQLAHKTSMNDVYELTKKNIIRCDGDKTGIFVHFRSPLTHAAIKEIKQFV